MTDEKKQKNPLGPTGQVVRQNVEQLRSARGLDYKKLSALLGEYGRPIPPLGLSRIEKGTRRVDADDLTALAVVLGVNPNRLLFPVGELPDDVALTPELTVPVGEVWAWALAQRALPLPGSDDEDFELNAVPRWLRRGSDHTASRAAVDVLRRVQQLVQAREAEVAEPAEFEGGVRTARHGEGSDAPRARAASGGDPDSVRRSVRRLRAEVADLIGDDDAGR
ncbi:hypothetical protein GCM10009676_31210 [Prauserella halophila]|uniref:HTH cro/C1-type domain-containing protein n=1 Tax=Prauserella halophila TaxID=185641 RepID=A0ABP4H349_9PSEU|nr:helix-turn-helix protein [Prauserella halophila]